MLQTNSEISALLEPIKRLNKDIRTAANTLSDTEARYLVDMYYQMQGNRIRSAGQVRSMEEEPNLVLGYLTAQSETLENSVKSALERYVAHHPVGKWLLSIYGIGPIIAAGLLAHIDITKANTAAKVWRYAGLDPTSKWDKKQKRPWNASLKTLCWKAGQSFMKFHNREDCFYGRLYREHKDFLIKRNEAGHFSEYAKDRAEKFGKATIPYASYKEGRLPAGHIDARARRYAVKIFLSHLQQVWWETVMKTPVAVPYAIAHLGHADLILPPNYTPLPRN